MPGGIPPMPGGIPPIPGGIPPGGPPGLAFAAITSSILNNIEAASMADLNAVNFTTIGSIIPDKSPS